MAAVRSATTLGALLILLLLAVVWGWTAVTQPLPDLTPEATTLPVCENRTVEPGTQVRPLQVTVSVFNAGTTSGKATQTMEQLLGHGFDRGDTGNVQVDKRVKRVQIWASDRDNPAVRLVASHLGDVRIVSPDGDPLGPGVVVVIGDGFTKPQKGRKAITVAEVAEICSPPA